MKPMNTHTWSPSKWDYLVETHKDPRYLPDRDDYGWSDSLGSVSFCGIIRSFGNVKTVLDYGCGKGTAMNSLKPDINITNYDPWIKEFSTFPTGKFDVVISSAVLNQVEDYYMDDVLNNIYNFANNTALIIISKRIDHRQEPYYTKCIEKRFNIIIRAESDYGPSLLDGVPRTKLFYQLEKLR